MRHTPLVLLAGFLGLLTPAVAEKAKDESWVPPRSPQAVKALFRAMDTDNDGRLSEEEFNKGRSGNQKGFPLFGELDLDDDASVSEDEFARLMAPPKKSRKGYDPPGSDPNVDLDRVPQPFGDQVFPMR
jgi:hypothetical protein